jgi:peptide deformylase
VVAGLAAPQIGVCPRVSACAVGSERGYLVNPVFAFPDEEGQDGEECACSSRASTRTCNGG